METLRKIRVLFREESRAKGFLLVLLGVVVSGIEVVGALLVFLLLGLIAAPTTAVEVPLVGDLRRLLPDVSTEWLLVSIAIFISAFFAVRALVIILRSYVQHRIIYNAGARLAGRLVDGYLRMPYVWHAKHNSAELLRNTFAANDMVIQNALLPVVVVGSELVLVAGLGILLIVMAPIETLVAVLVLAPVIVVLLRIVQPRLKTLGEEFESSNRESFQAFQQALGALREIRVLGREQFFQRRFMQQRMRLAHTHYLYGTLRDVPRAIIESSLVVMIAGLLLLAIVGGDSLEALLSRLGLFAYAGIRIQPSLQKIVQGVNNLRYGAAAVDDVAADLAQFERHAERRVRPGAIGPLRDSIRLVDVDFAYGPGGPPALRGVSLTIRRGEIVGVCGPTGGGKSTLVDIITGLLGPTSGQVLIDGIPLDSDPHGWFSQLGVVSQTVYLIDDTLRRNVALGLDADEIDDDRIQMAVERAQLGSTVDSLPDGLATVVGERGVRLSGGQRQRVAVARALYREPTVIVFDEGTSALDTVTEAHLVQELLRTGHQPTIIMVAHRLATVRDADRIFIIDRGQVCGEGSYDHLLEHSEIFRAMATGGDVVRRPR